MRRSKTSRMNENVYRSSSRELISAEHIANTTKHSVVSSVSPDSMVLLFR
jgi:hypothetical protein